jgi:ABC-type transport system involved in multi-copper enzyme maturation permease subunit
MLPGPLFRVDLVATSRRTRYFVLRIIYGLLLLFFLWTCVAQYAYVGGIYASNIQRMAALAESFFVSFSWAQIIAVLLVGPAAASTTIATERMRRTIEYLFATDLSNAEIVLGKLASKLVSVGALVLVGLPILAIFRLLGGIPFERLVTVYVITASTMVLVCSVSICISVWSIKPRDSIVRAYLFFVVFLLSPALPAVLAEIWRSQGWNAQNSLELATYSLLQLNPMYVLMDELYNRFGPVTGQAGSSLRNMLIGHLSIAAASVLIATTAVRRVHLRSAGVAKRRRFGFRLPKFRLPLGDRAMLWKELFASHSNMRLGVWGALLVVILLVLLVTVTVWTWWEVTTSYRSGYYGSYADRAQDYIQYACLMSAGIGTMGLLMILARAAGGITSEREQDTWVSLLTSPLSSAEIIWAKIAGNVYAARWIWAVQLFVWAPGMLLDPFVFWSVFWGSITFWCLAFFVASLGTLCSLKCKTSLWAIGAALGIGIFMGGGYLLCCIPLAITGGPGGPEEFLLAGCIPFLLGCSVYMPTEFASFLSTSGQEVLFAYCCGLMVYGLVSVLIASSAVVIFDAEENRPVEYVGQGPFGALQPPVLGRRPPVPLATLAEPPSPSPPPPPVPPPPE